MVRKGIVEPHRNLFSMEQKPIKHCVFILPPKPSKICVLSSRWLYNFCGAWTSWSFHSQCTLKQKKKPTHFDENENSLENFNIWETNYTCSHTNFNFLQQSLVFNGMEQRPYGKWRFWYFNYIQRNYSINLTLGRESYAFEHSKQVPYIKSIFSNIINSRCSNFWDTICIDLRPFSPKSWATFSRYVVCVCIERIE